jgi:hypothetical protein
VGVFFAGDPRPCQRDPCLREVHHGASDGPDTWFEHGRARPPVVRGDAGEASAMTGTPAITLSTTRCLTTLLRRIVRDRRRSSTWSRCSWRLPPSQTGPAFLPGVAFSLTASTGPIAGPLVRLAGRRPAPGVSGDCAAERASRSAGRRPGRRTALP